jgi:hypothetical protein
MEKAAARVADTPPTVQIGVGAEMIPSYKHRVLRFENTLDTSENAARYLTTSI